MVPSDPEAPPPAHAQQGECSATTPAEHSHPSDAQELARSRDGLQFFLTYADNAAVGYFEKQGFSTEVSQPKERVGPALAAHLRVGAEAALGWHGSSSSLHALSPGPPLQSHKRAPQACSSCLTEPMLGRLPGKGSSLQPFPWGSLQ